jgi:hypothetical protein
MGEKFVIEATGRMTNRSRIKVIARLLRKEKARPITNAFRDKINGRARNGYAFEWLLYSRTIDST